MTGWEEELGVTRFVLHPKNIFVYVRAGSNTTKLKYNHIPKRKWLRFLYALNEF
jgi:hypothetical protein